MSFKVDTREVSALADKMNAASNVLENDLHTVTQQLDELTALESFSGAAPTNAKNYFETFHKTAIESIQLMAQQLSANIHTHIDTFKSDVDSHESARIDYNYLQEVKKNVQTVHEDLAESVGNITDTLEDISDIVTIDPPSMIELETEKNNMVKSIDVLTKNVELFTEKGADHDDEMKEMLHHLETMINEASSSTGETRFTTIESANTINSLAFLGEANQLLGERQRERQAEQVRQTFLDTPRTVAVADPNPVEKAEKNPLEIFLDVFIGGSKAIYHFTEDFVLGVVEMIEDPVAAIEALATMVFNPIDTGYYLGKMIVDSFVRDVIHGDAESRAHWFTYALSTVLGPKAVKQVGKKVDSKAKAGAQKAEQQLEDLLPYHQKHQVALVGPVPYNVLNGGFFVDRLVMMVERTPGSLGGMSAGGRKVSKGIRKANPEKVLNALSNFQSRKMTFGNQQFLLDKKGLMHILERHHPEFWNGTAKKNQTFFDKRIMIDDLVSIVQSVMKQNRAKLIDRGTTSAYQISGNVNGIDYIVGLNNGRVGQLYSK